MPGFIGGLPAQGSPLVSADVRNNFLALNARTDKLTPRATVPASTRVNIGTGIIYFADHVQVRFAGQQIDLGSDFTGVSPFNNIGYFKDIVIVLRQGFDADSNRYTAEALFLEGPEKASSTAQPELVQMASTDLPIAAFTVRHNGLNIGTFKGQIEAIEQSKIIDMRNYIDAGGITYYSTTVGDRLILEDGYGTVIPGFEGLPAITGETVGVFTGYEDDGYGNLIHPIQRAIDHASSIGGGVVFLRRGRYVPPTTITIPDNVVVRGEGRNTIIEREDTFSGPLFKLTGKHASLSDVFIQGPATYILAFGPLIEFSGAQYGSVKDCIIDAAGVTAVSFVDISLRNNFTNNFIIAAATAIYFSADSEKNLVTLNQIDNTTTAFADDSFPGQNIYRPLDTGDGALNVE